MRDIALPPSFPYSIKKNNWTLAYILLRLLYKYLTEKN